METTSQAGKSLQEWAEAHEPSETLIYSGGYWDQVMFVRDKVLSLLVSTYEEYTALRDERTRVISTHSSKSVSLPVISIELSDGTTFTMRYNFYNWKVSVNSPLEVDVDFMGLFDPEDARNISGVYCEGFPAERVYGPYAENKQQFTVELPPGNHHIFTFFWIFAHQVLGIRK